MKHDERERLMHAVLDGEATQDEARELERLLAADPAVRVQFDELKALFDGLSRVPQGYPPEGLVAAVMADVSRSPRARADAGQLFPPPGVIAASSKETRPYFPGDRQPVPANDQTGPHIKGATMSEQQRGFSKRKIWIGVAAAIAGVVVISQYVDFPPGGQNAAGTIAPAQRYRAEQPTAGDVKLGGQAASPGATTPAGAGQGSAGQSGGNLSGGNASGSNMSGGNLSGGNLSGGNLSGGNLSGGNLSGGNLSGGNLSGGNASGSNMSGGNLSGGNQSASNLSGGGMQQGGNLNAHNNKK